MSGPNKDLVAIFEYMEREKGIDRKSVANVIAESLLVAARKSVHDTKKVEVSVDYRTGAIELVAEKTVVEKVLSKGFEISLKEAIKIDPDCKLGDVISVLVTPKDFGRIAAQKARQAIVSKLKIAEKDIIHAEYKNSVNKLINCVVKKIVGGGIVVDLGKVEAFVPRKAISPLDNFSVGDRTVFVLLEVKDLLDDGAELVLSRSDPEFIHRLLIQQVPEISSGIVVVEKLVREAGLRTKVAVRSTDSSVDPVKVCVGFKGTKIRNIMREVGNEKVEIFLHSSNSIDLIRNAIGNISIKKLYVEDEVVYIVVADDDYAAALGKKGSNVRLLGSLVDIRNGVSIVKQSIYEKRVVTERYELSNMNSSAIDLPLELDGVSSLIVDSLNENGFKTYRDLLCVGVEDIAQVPGVSLDLATRILEQITKKVKNLGKEFEAQGQECSNSRADIEGAQEWPEDEDQEGDIS